MGLLLVDDDEICIFLNTKILRHAGCQDDIHTAGNGLHALEILKSNMASGLPLPRTILLDLDMPVMDGFTFLKSFRELKLPGSQHVRIIIVSSSVTREDRDKAIALGAGDFLQKPLDVQNVESLLRHNVLSP
jgi:CheY-like chemotaxis protein